jgi:hypothetical protein
MEIKGGLKEQGSKGFICREEKGCMGLCSRTWKPVVPWVRLEIGFYSFFYCPRVEILAWMDVKGEVSALEIDVSWKGEGAFFYTLAN